MGWQSATESLVQNPDLLRKVLARYNENSDLLPPSPSGRGWGWGNNAGVEHSPQLLPAGEGLSPATRPSMAETLSAAFGGSAAAMPGHVRNAYGKLKAVGL